MDLKSDDDEKIPLMFEESQTRKKTFRGILRDEFRWNSFSFDFSNASAFYRSQWRSPRLLFVLFRLSLALYTGSICIMTLVYFPHKNPHRPWLVFLSNWSYLLLTCHEICSATIVLVHSTDGSTTGCCCRELEDGEDKESNRRRNDGGWRRDELPFYMKLGWFLFIVASNVALLVTGLIMSTSDLRQIPVKDFHNHIMSGVIVVLELCVVALPVRLLHVVYVFIYYSIYFVYAYIYWSFDHTNNVLYPGLIDWNEPKQTMLVWVFLYLLIPIVIQIFLFLIYRLKLFICAKIYADAE